MSEISDIQEGLAEAFNTLLDIAVGSTIPATLRAKTAHVSPADDGWFSTIDGDATFARPVVIHELVLVAPAYDFPQRQVWLQEQIEAVSTFSRTTDTTVAGRRFPKMLTARIGMIDQANGLLGARCQFTPIQLKGGC